jgi:hypothetical protein
MNKLLSTLDIKDHVYGQITSATIKAGFWTLTTTQDVDADRNYYSKAWHRSHGPKFTVYNRSITLSRKHGRGVMTRSVNIDSWSGDYLAKAVIELGLTPKHPKLPLSVRLNKAYDAKLIKIIRGHKIYSRTLLGEHCDYVIIAPMGTVYHDSIYKNLVKGLYKKVRAAASRVNFGDGLVNWDACRKLGFCKEGISSFCSDFGFNPKKEYSPSEIEKAVRNNPSIAAPYLAELKTLAAAYNYVVAEL